MEQVAVPLPAPPQSAPRRWLIAGAALIGALVIVGGALVATKIFAATRSTFANSIPPQTAAFVHIDLLNVVRSGELERMIEAFEVEDELGEPVGDAVSEIDRLLLEEGDFDLTNDIIPWMGRGVGVGVTTFGLSGLEPEFIAAIDVRDSGEFDRFFPKLRSTIEETDGPLLESDYQGVTIFTSTDGAFALSKAVFLIGSNSFAVEDAIDAQSGESLADAPDFDATLELLPEDRVLTVWINAAKYIDELEGFGGLTGGFEELGVFDPTSGPTSYGFSGQFVDAGLRFDFAAIYPETSEALAPWNDFQLETAELAPDSTLGFFAAPPFIEFYADTIQEAFAEEYDDARRQGIEEYGIDFESDFIDLLDGEFGFLVTREDGGVLDREFGFPVGLAAFLGTSEQDRLLNTVARFIDIGIGEFGGEATLVLGPSGDPNLFEYADEYFDYTIPFGVDYGYLMSASDRRILQTTFATGGNKLADDPTYRAAASDLDDMEHVFYVDFLKIFDLIRSMDPDDNPEFPVALESILAGFKIDGNVQTGALVVAIDY